LRFVPSLLLTEAQARDALARLARTIP